MCCWIGQECPDLAKTWKRCTHFLPNSEKTQYVFSIRNCPNKYKNSLNNAYYVYISLWKCRLCLVLAAHLEWTRRSLKLDYICIPVWGIFQRCTSMLCIPRYSRCLWGCPGLVGYMGDMWLHRTDLSQARNT